MKENKKEYPLSYFLANKETKTNIGQEQKTNKVMRSMILIGESERASNTILHWKPISKIY